MISKNTESPFISIIIPVYNVEKYISRCLESCINQSFSDIEILIIDDCGSDNSIAIAKKFAKKDKRIRILKNEKNLGTFNARIKGIKEAKGIYLLFLDSDDFIDNDTCKKAHTKALKYKESTLPDIIFFGMRFYPPTIKRVAPPVILEELHNDEILKKTFNHSTPPWHIWAKLYKASHINKTIDLLRAYMGEFPRLNMAEDALKSFAILALAKKSVGIKDRLYIYCDNQESITKRIDEQSIRKKINDFDLVLDFLDRFGEIKEIRENKYFHISKEKTKNILKAQRELEFRYLPKDIASNIVGGGNCRCSPLPQYLNAALKSLKYHHKWQTYVRILAYIMSLSKIKL